MANLYEILGVSEDATQQEIKTSYRKLSRRYHPDMTGDAEGHFFKMLAEAHETLVDPERREAYDATLNNADPPWEKTYEPRGESAPPRSAPAGIPAAPAINWDSVKWKKEYPRREKVVFKKPYQDKAILLSVLSIILLVSAGFISLGIPLFNEYPISLIAVLGLAILGIQLSQFKIDEKWFGVIAGMFIVANGAIMVMWGGEKIGLGFLETFLLAASASLMVYAYLTHIKWLIVKKNRGVMGMTNKQVKTGQKWSSQTRTIHPGGESDQRANNVAEKRSGSLVEELVTIPGTRILNGVLHPTSTWEKVQHVALNGNKVYLVDSLMLPGGQYYWIDGDTISAVRPAGYEYDVAVGTPTALREFRRTFIEADFRACIVLYSLDGEPIELIDHHQSHDGVELFTPQDFIEDSGEWFTEGKIGVINRGLLNGFVNRL